MTKTKPNQKKNFFNVRITTYYRVYASSKEDAIEEAYKVLSQDFDSMKYDGLEFLEIFDYDAEED